MKKLAAIALSTATASVVVLTGGTAQGSGSSGAWPAAFPLPTHPGRVLSQTSGTAVVRSTDTVFVVKQKLDQLYVNQKGCTVRVVVNKPKDYLCRHPATGKTVEVYFTFAALDPKPTDPSVSQTNAYLGRG
jgi:hypothetical protein